MCHWHHGLLGAAGQLVFTQVSYYEVSVVICEGSLCEDLPWGICWPHMQAITDMDKQGMFLSTCRDCPPREQLSGEQLVTRSEDGKSFTGRKDLLEESGTYTPQFGSSVAHIFATEFQRLRHMWIICLTVCASCMHAVRCVVHGGLSSPHWQLLQIRFSTRDKHVFHLIGVSEKNMCSWQVQLNNILAHWHVQKSANSKWHTCSSTCLTWGCMAMFWNKDRSSDTWNLCVLLTANTEIVTHVLCFALARRKVFE